MMHPYFIIIPLCTAFLITFIAGKNDRIAIVLSLLATSIMLAIALVIYPGLNDRCLVYEMGNWPLPFGIALVLDSFSGFMLVVVLLLAVTSLLYSMPYLEMVGRDWKYYALFMLMLAGMCGVVLTGDIFNLFVFMEIGLLAAFALVAFGCQAEEYEASFKYAVMGTVSSTLILFGIAILYSSTSTLTMAKIAALLPDLSPKVVWGAGALLLAGFGLKSAIMPFHAWLPDAHSSAPAPISAMLSGVLIKALGIYVLVRLFYNVFGAPQLFMQIFVLLGLLSIIIGVLLAIAQWDMKRLLAYHSISQVGYIILGIGLGTPLAILGAVYHLFNHALFKGLLFYNAGAVEVALGTRNLKRMGNLIRALPIASHTSMVASLSIAGIPPFNGFFSKLIIIIAAIQADRPIAALIAMIGSILTLASFMKVQRYGFRGERAIDKVMPVGWGMNAAMIILALLCVLSSLMIVPGIKEIVLDPVVTVIAGKTHYIQLVLGR
ncbi:MAG: NADH/ubiquinone/plastoquinone (complex I) [Calditrichaeota bacterium]|nr:MAG: NADH/ubiquinone/plastoquinone (complex I) [Calditrichota bacterium]